MKKILLILAATLFTAVLMAGTVVAKDNNNGVPFQELWDAIQALG